jgi:hypothetical protein
MFTPQRQHLERWQENSTHLSFTRVAILCFLLKHPIYLKQKYSPLSLKKCHRMEHTYVYRIVWANLSWPERKRARNIYIERQKKIIKIHSDVSSKRTETKGLDCELWVYKSPSFWDVVPSRLEIGARKCKDSLMVFGNKMSTTVTITNTCNFSNNEKYFNIDVQKLSESTDGLRFVPGDFWFTL